MKNENILMDMRSKAELLCFYMSADKDDNGEFVSMFNADVGSTTSTYVRSNNVFTLDE